jgi:hypothetical protein
MAIFIGSSGISLACRCTEPAPRQAYRAASTVAFGKVVAVRKENGGEDAVYSFEVSESWKQRLESQITVHSGEPCRFEANVGEKYVFFIKQYKPDSYDTAMCMGNSSEARAQALLNFLRATKPNK